MFTCLEILPENEGIFSKIYERIKPPQPEREYVQVRGGTPFLRLKVRENHMSWAKISAVLEKNERRILSSVGGDIPRCVNLTMPKPQALGTNIMFRSALGLLGKKESPKDISFSLYDRSGACIKLIESLVPLVRYVSVYTEKIRECFYAASKIMEESGMSIKINEYESSAPPGEIIVADDYRSTMKDAKLVFLSSSDVISYNTVTGEGFSLSEDYKTLKSGCIDDFLFASALYEYNNVRSFADESFEHFCLAGRRTDEDNLLSRLV